MSGRTVGHRRHQEKQHRRHHEEKDSGDILNNGDNGNYVALGIADALGVSPKGKNPGDKAISSNR